MTRSTLISASGNRKGAIFAIDGAIAVTLGIIVLAYAMYFAAYTEGDPSAKLAMYRTAQDMMSAMDYQGYFDRFSMDEMSNFTNSTLPSNMKMQLTLKVYNASQSTLVVGPASISTNNSVMHGDWITTVRNDPAVARFAVWQ